MCIAKCSLEHGLMYAVKVISNRQMYKPIGSRVCVCVAFVFFLFFLTWNGNANMWPPHVEIDRWHRDDNDTDNVFNTQRDHNTSWQETQLKMKRHDPAIQMENCTVSVLLIFTIRRQFIRCGFKIICWLYAVGYSHQNDLFDCECC